MNQINESNLLNAVLKNSSSIIACVDCDLNYQYVNEAYENWFGIKSSKLIGVSAREILGSEAHQKLKPRIDRALNGETISFEMEVPYRYGGNRFVKTSYIPDKNADGIITGLIIISEDMTSQVLAERKVEVKDAEIKKIIDSVPIIIGQWDKNLLNVHANSAYEYYFGKAPNEIKSCHLKDVIGPELFEKNLPYIDKVLKGIPQSFELEIAAANGKIKSTIATYIPNITNGEVEGFFATVTDISEIKDKSRELQGQKKFFYEILNSMHEGFCVQDSNAKILFFNDSAASILGLTNDQLLGKTSMDPGWQALKADGSIFPGIEHPAMVTIKTGRAELVVTMGIRTPDGQTRWLNVNSVPFYSEFEGQKSSVLVTFDDVTDKFKKEKLIKAVITNSPGMIYQFKLTNNGEMSFPFVSPKAYEICEVTPEEFEKDSFILVNLIIDEDRDHLLEAITYSAKHLTTFEWTGRLRTPLGREKWIKAKSIPRQEHDNSVTWDGILNDVTHEVQMQEELIRERSRAAHAAKLASLGEMSAGVAHEINNPLAIILGISKNLKHHLNDPEKFEQKILDINRSVMRISKIVNGLKRFSRSETIGNVGSFTIDHILKESNTYFEMRARQDFIDLKFEINSKSQIKCDPLEIEQVLINLINNAIDAVKNLDQKWVHVTVNEENADLVIRVIDSGYGISESVEQKLFDPFFTTKVIGQGTGLGLSISNGIIKEHGGTITLIKNLPNTCFEVRLPIDQTI